MTITYPLAHQGQHTRTTAYRPRHRGRPRPGRYTAMVEPRHRRPVVAPGRHRRPVVARPRPHRPRGVQLGYRVSVVTMEQPRTAYCCVVAGARFRALSALCVIEVTIRAHTDVDYA